MDTVGDLLRDASKELASEFEIPIPGALRYALGLPVPVTGGHPLHCSISRAVAPRCSPGRGCYATARSTACASSPPRRNIGVANTWGAKGVFNWDSPHHLGTCGLQAHDFELLGFGELDLLWIVGLDPDESPPRALRARCADRADPTRGPCSVRDASRSVVVSRSRHHRSSSGSPRSRNPATSTNGSPAIRPARSWRSSSGWHPVRSSRRSRDPRGSGSRARSPPTRRAPSSSRRSLRRASESRSPLAAARAGLDATAVAVEPLDDTTRALSTSPQQLDVPLTVEVWGDDVDLSLTSLLVDAAGPVVAWAS